MSLAAAIGVPVAALENVQLSWPNFQDPPSPESFSAQQIEREAVVDRLDVRAALVEYAAVEQALRLEIAKQYPDFNIGPGYQLEERDNFFTIGFSTVLPVFNRNQGPIAEARSCTQESRSGFSSGSGTGDCTKRSCPRGLSLSFCRTRPGKKRVGGSPDAATAMQRRAVALGESDQPSLNGILLEGSAAALLELDALSRVQSALGALINGYLET